MNPIGYPNENLLYVPENPHQAGTLQYIRCEYLKVTPVFKKYRWKRIRKRWMKMQEEIHGRGNLTCSICGKTNLNPWSDAIENKATCDHIKPMSKAPHLWNVFENFQVACVYCNGSKENYSKYEN